MLDVPGTRLTPDDERRLGHPLVGGVILFARNYVDRQQLLALTSEIHALRADLLIAVDQEGGRVQRFRGDGFTRLPAARELGLLWDRDPLLATTAATAAAFVLAAELRAHGVDLTFAPVLDLDYQRSRAIGDRALHRDPFAVSMLAKSLAHGFALAGMANCGKHFPGHGFVEADSHLDPAVDTRGFDEIAALDLKPYGGLDFSLRAVMAAHVVYPQVDSRPAGFSDYWLKTVLREQLGFTGAVFSDDLSMEGARIAGDIVKGAQLALDAGCDMVLVCNAPDKADQVLAALRDPGDVARTQRVAALKPAEPGMDWTELRDDPRYRRACELLTRCFDGLVAFG